MKMGRSCILAGIFIFLAASTGHSQGTAFTYQGSLSAGASPASGIYDFTFSLYDSPTNGALIAGPITNAATPVSTGIFITSIDFGTVFTGSNYWLDIAVRTNGDITFTELCPRQPITSTPYAVTANNANNLAGFASNSLVTNNATGISLTGTFAGDGSGLTGLTSNQVPGLSWTNIVGSLPTTLAGYGITDAQRTNTNLTVLAANNGGNLTNLMISNASVAVEDASFFGDLANNAIANSAFFPAPTGVQALMTYYPSIGGSQAGQLWYSMGPNTQWRREFQFGRVAIYNDNPTVPEALLVKSTNNSADNVITIQNQSPYHYSAMRWIDSSADADERGAIGWGNSNAPFYVENNYLEDNGNFGGFYFASKGFINGGLERYTGHFVWYTGTEGTNDSSSTKVFDLNTDGVVSCSDLVFGYGNSAMRGGAGVSLTVGRGNFDYIDTEWLDPDGTLIGTNINLGSGFSFQAGFAPPFQFLTAPGLAMQAYKYGTTFLNTAGVEELSFDPGTINGGISNVSTPWAVFVGSTNKHDTTNMLQVTGSAYVSSNVITGLNAGFTTVNTNLFAFTETGWTNTNTYDCTIAVSVSDAAVTLSDGTNTIHTTPEMTGELPAWILHPGYAVTATGGLSGNAYAQ